jgi:hypothetical protein
VNQIGNDSNSTAQSEYAHQNQYNQRSQFNERTFERGSFGAAGRGREKGKAPLKPEDMYCIIHEKRAGHTSKMCPKVKKSIEEAQEENRAQSQ